MVRAAANATVVDSTFNGNGRGVEAQGPIKILNTTVTGNGNVGVFLMNIATCLNKVDAFGNGINIVISPQADVDLEQVNACFASVFDIGDYTNGQSAAFVNVTCDKAVNFSIIEIEIGCIPCPSTTTTQAPL